MTTPSQGDRIVDRALDRLNAVLLDEQAIPKDRNTVIFGANALLDSMGFINFIVALEEAIEGETGLVLNVVEEMKNASENHLSTLGDICSLVSRLIAQNKP